MCKILTINEENLITKKSVISILVYLECRQSTYKGHLLTYKNASSIEKSETTYLSWCFTLWPDIKVMIVIMLIKLVSVSVFAFHISISATQLYRRMMTETECLRIF